MFTQSWWEANERFHIFTQHPLWVVTHAAWIFKVFTSAGIFWLTNQIEELTTKAFVNRKSNINNNNNNKREECFLDEGGQIEPYCFRSLLNKWTSFLIYVTTTRIQDTTSCKHKRLAMFWSFHSRNNHCCGEHGAECPDIIKFIWWKHHISITVTRWSAKFESVKTAF